MSLFICINLNIKEEYSVKLLNYICTVEYFRIKSLVIENEVWRDIIGYEGLYQISDLGRVKSLARWYKSSVSLYMKENIKNQRINHGGYLYLDLSKNGKKKSFTVHSLVAAAFIGKRPINTTIDHKNGNKLDNRVCNLEYCSIQENISRFRHLFNDYKGENHPMSRLTEEDVINIRKLYQEGNIKQKDIAKMYNITQVMVSRIHRRIAWSHI